MGLEIFKPNYKEHIYRHDCRIKIIYVKLKKITKERIKVQYIVLVENKIT